MKMCHQLLTFPTMSLDLFTVVVDTVHLLIIFMILMHTTIRNSYAPSSEWMA